MVGSQDLTGRLKGYAVICGGALVCALLSASLPQDRPFPIIGEMSLPVITGGAAILGAGFMVVLRSRGVGTGPCPGATRRQLLALTGMAAVLSVPPVLIDVFRPFPHDMNVPFPGALLFYPAIALVAEVAMHLLPLAVLTGLARNAPPPGWVYGVAILVEPAFQAFSNAETGIQAWLVFGNVSMVSAVQIWLFRRYGFVAMHALRLLFYLFWHVLWGTARLHLVV